MRVPVKLLGFGFWLFFLNCAQCQECLREDIIYENTELVAKASYTDRETVKVNCMTGYIGSYKLKCENGQWKKMVGRSCAKKKCNHPGDTPNGDFKLTDGMEFVFGVTVVYTCNTGYEMASRINQRTCRSQGWDNAVPVCEVVKCPVIRTDGDVTASGNTEEGSYGDVIHFECVSSDKKIDGSSDIHCEETGKWSDVVPKCKDITCAVPVISNGHIDEPLPEYQKDAILKYKCNPRFKPREGIPKCTKFGWTLNPECDEVTCDLKSTTFGIKNINPQGKTIFRAGERVEITCSEKYWLFLTKETSKSFICKDNGKWDHEPVCEEIKCEVPHDQHVNSPDYYFSGDKKLGKKISYYCKSGYEKMAEKATCTQDGWTPKPLCAEKMCTAPNIPNAEIVGSQQPNYRINSKIQYKCSPGFEPEQSVQITCNSQAQWTAIKQCTEKMCIAPNIPNAEIVGGQQPNYRINSRIKYKCSPGFEPEQPVQITCSSQGQWTEIQQCTEIQKCLNLHLENGFIYSQSSNKEETIYSCNTGYKPFTGNWWDSVTCSKGSWSDEPRCIREEECGALPSVHHGKLKQTKQTFHDGNTTIFECDPGFISTHRFIKCINGTWETPVCKVGVRCDIPPKVKNAVITTKPEEFYVDGSNVTYKCQSSFLIIGNSTVFCCNGTWEETPTCEEEVHCEIPPNVENAVITSKPQEFYLDGSNVTYMCQSSFLMSGKITVFCRNGTWEETPKCEAKCHRPHENFMRLVNEKDVYDNKEILKYNCIEPYNEIPEGQLICENGKWSGNFVCTNPICPPPPYVENGDYNKRYQQEIVITMVYYTCQPYYVLNEQKQYYKCDNGKWETPPKCLKPCEITPEIREAHDLQNKREKSYLRHGESQDFYCKYRQNIGWTRVFITCSDGKLNFEPCKKYK